MTALMTEKMAAFAPMPRASDRMAASENPGVRRIVRMVYRRSWPKSSHHRPRDQTPSNLHQFRANGNPLEADAEVVFGDLDLRAGGQAGAFPDSGGNDHPACLVNG